jgi:hypothetical protein
MGALSATFAESAAGLPGQNAADQSRQAITEINDDQWLVNSGRYWRRIATLLSHQLHVVRATRHHPDAPLWHTVS